LFHNKDFGSEIETDPFRSTLIGALYFMVEKK